ncbi:DUF2239 family protein [Phenylobacterium sp.]|jgi:hypothetical protein|uniref:DUF2239 family protein n=1 Tax=Phenylobacterium sp. TaxID=1871053 RepID=UPI003782D43B
MDATYTAFLGADRLAAGSGADVAAACRRLDASAASPVIFDDATGQRVEVDPFAEPPALAAPGQPQPSTVRPGRGRPKLGVVAREVTLLPRHWDWLSTQAGGASAAIRRLVEDARRGSAGADAARQAQEALYRVMSVLAGDLPGFEDAARALYGRDDAALDAHLGRWPADVAAYLTRLAATERAARPL